MSLVRKSDVGFSKAILPPPHTSLFRDQAPIVTLRFAYHSTKQRQFTHVSGGLDGTCESLL